MVPLHPLTILDPLFTQMGFIQVQTVQQLMGLLIMASLATKTMTLTTAVTKNSVTLWTNLRTTVSIRRLIQTMFQIPAGASLMQLCHS